MTLDLTAAIEAAARAEYEHDALIYAETDAWADYRGRDGYKAAATVAITAALPLILGAVGEALDAEEPCAENKCTFGDAAYLVRSLSPVGVVEGDPQQ